jgi:hypothetical protein
MPDRDPTVMSKMHRFMVQAFQDSPLTVKLSLLFNPLSLGGLLILLFKSSIIKNIWKLAFV